MTRVSLRCHTCDEVKPREEVDLLTTDGGIEHECHDCRDAEPEVEEATLRSW